MTLPPTIRPTISQTPRTGMNVGTPHEDALATTLATIRRIHEMASAGGMGGTPQPESPRPHLRLVVDNEDRNRG